jgi:hypothetical protein
MTTELPTGRSHKRTFEGIGHEHASACGAGHSHLYPHLYVAA